MNQAATVEVSLDKMARDAKKAHLVIRAFNHKLRQQILNYIRVKEDATVTAIYHHMRLEQSVASQHLAILRDAGLVNTRRDGKHIYYSINQRGIESLQECCIDLLNIKRGGN